MRITVKLLIESEALSERTETTVAAFDRDELTAASLGLRLAEAKALLEGVQRSVVDAQVRITFYEPAIAYTVTRRSRAKACIASPIARPWVDCRYRVRDSISVRTATVLAKASVHWRSA